MHARTILKSQWPSLAMVVLLILAWGAPRIAHHLADNGILRTLAIVVIFFMSGLDLPVRKAIAGVANWRLHLFIQITSFIIFPAIYWFAIRPFGDAMPHALLTGFCIFAVLPTTITSCVVFTRLANGNFGGAMFNAVLGNIVGLVVSPALFILLTGTAENGIDLDAGRVFVKLARIVLLPLVVGQIVRAVAGDKLGKITPAMPAVNRCCILVIVYLSFGNLFAPGVLDRATGAVVLPLVLLVPGHLAGLWLVWTLSRLFRFDHGDRVAILFTAPQKTLALGFPMIIAILSDRPDMIGLASLPIIVYHVTQLLAAGFAADNVRS